MLSREKKHANEQGRLKINIGLIPTLQWHVSQSAFAAQNCLHSSKLPSVIKKKPDQFFLLAPHRNEAGTECCPTA